MIKRSVKCRSAEFLLLWLFLQVCMETQRFEKLMEYFKNEDTNIDFMVSTCTRVTVESVGRGGCRGGVEIPPVLRYLIAVLCVCRCTSCRCAVQFKLE